jgi:short-chain fatty acids transporter
MAGRAGTKGRATSPPEHDTWIARLALRFTDFTERWMPDAFIFALLGTLIVIVAAYLVDGKVRAKPITLVDAWGSGFLNTNLLIFALQMTLIIITGYVLATAPPVFRLIGRIADMPKNPRAAVATVAVAAMVSAWFSWGFSLIFSAVLAREVAKRVKGTDYRALAASSFLGLGTVWAQGISGSAALQMASKDSIPGGLLKIVGGTIPLTRTIFLWQSLLSVVVEIVIVGIVAYLYVPRAQRAVTAEQMGVTLESREEGTAASLRGRSERGVPGEWLERSPLLIIGFVILGLVYVVHYFQLKGGFLEYLDLNRVIFIFLLIGALLHWTPGRLAGAVRQATPAAWGVLLQFPFYFGIYGIMVNTGLSKWIANIFVHTSGAFFYPALVAIYSAVLGIFIPSGGSKWVVEATYVIEAAKQLHVNLGWMVATYDLGEAIANLLQPFWMLPILALLQVRARDIMGYTFIVALVLIPVVLIQVTLFALTLPYP